MALLGGERGPKVTAQGEVPPEGARRVIVTPPPERAALPGKVAVAPDMSGVASRIGRMDEPELKAVAKALGLDVGMETEALRTAVGEKIAREPAARSLLSKARAMGRTRKAVASAATAKEAAASAAAAAKNAPLWKKGLKALGGLKGVAGSLLAYWMMDQAYDKFVGGPKRERQAESLMSRQAELAPSAEDIVAEAMLGDLQARRQAQIGSLTSDGQQYLEQSQMAQMRQLQMQRLQQQLTENEIALPGAPDQSGGNPLAALGL